MVQMMRLVSEQLPILTLYYSFTASAYLAGLNGPTPDAWKIHQWHWQ